MMEDEAAAKSKSMRGKGSYLRDIRRAVCALNVSEN